MTIQEVKNNFVQNLAENAYINMCSVEEMKIAIEALEKQIPKKPIINKENINYVNYKIYMCPCCKKQIIKKIDGDIFVGRIPYHCDNCGKALDWSEINNG